MLDISVLGGGGGPWGIKAVFLLVLLLLKNMRGSFM